MPASTGIERTQVLNTSVNRQKREINRSGDREVVSLDEPNFPLKLVQLTTTAFPSRCVEFSDS